MKTAYTFSVLRYVHDPVTAEFVNIGVALYAPEAQYLNALCTQHYQRLTRMFEPIDGDHFRQITRYVESQIEALGQRLVSELPFKNPPKNIEEALRQVLPPDDSAFQFSTRGGGFTTDLTKTMNELYARYVEKYSTRVQRPSRGEEDVWKVFREPLEKRQVTRHLSPKKIVAPDYDYEFERARKNQVWHAYEPISFDLAEADSIKDKANRWLGRVTSLADSQEKFTLHLLIGKPHESRLQMAFIQAQNILNKMPVKHEFVQEDEAEQFAESLANEIKEHGDE